MSRTIHQNRASAITYLMRILHGQMAFSLTKYLKAQFVSNLPVKMSIVSIRDFNSQLEDLKLLESRLIDLQNLINQKLISLNELSKRISEEDHATRKSA